MQKQVIVALVVAAMCVVVFAADPKTDALKHIDQGKVALQADKAQEAIGHLQKAISLIQKTLMSGFDAEFVVTAPQVLDERVPRITVAVRSVRRPRIGRNRALSRP